MSLSDNTEHARDPRDAPDFSGKTVFIMGGTSGINRGIAEAFAARGGRMAVASGAVIPVDGGWALGGFSALGAALSELAERAGR